MEVEDRGAREPTITDRVKQLFKPEFRFGLGGVSLGNEFNKHTDKDAEGTLEAAWDMGMRYFDVAPWYGFGLVDGEVRAIRGDRVEAAYKRTTVRAGSADRRASAIGAEASRRIVAACSMP
jgi:hypothetical protein